MPLDEYPQYYYISKGIAHPVMDENEEVPVMELECYCYEVTKEKNGWLTAQCPELHVVTHAKDWKKLKDNIAETHSFILDDS